MPTNLSISASRNVVMWTNTFTLLAGLILFAIGLSGLFSPDVRLYSDALPLATLIVGLLVFLISIIGCCGAMWDHRPVLIVYSVILTTLVIIQVIAAIIAIVDSQNIGSVLDRAWDVAYNNNPKIIRDIEDEYECCGFKNTTDRAFPKHLNCTESPWFGYETSCYNSIYNSYKNHQTFLEIGGIFLALIQLLALVCTVLLIYKLPNNEERERQYRDEHQRLVEEGRGHTSSGQYRSHGAHASDNCASSTAYGST